MPAAIDLLTHGKIHTAALRGAVLSLDSFDEALALLTRSSPQRSATRVSLKHTSR
jgi:hypothetical protein